MQRNLQTIGIGIMKDKEGNVVEKIEFNHETGEQKIIYQHPKIKKWREEIKKNPHAEVDHTIKEEKH